MNSSLISAPLLWPCIEPRDWSQWWSIWTRQARTITKLRTTYNRTGIGSWRGFDIWVAPGVDSEFTSFQAQNLNCPELFPSLFDRIDQFPVDIKVMRVVSSTMSTYPHQDADPLVPSISVRTMLYDNNFTPTFYYLDQGRKHYQTLPPDTNTWFYWDNRVKHGTDFYHGHHKQLIIYYGDFKMDRYSEFCQASRLRWPNLVIDSLSG